jgi:hypothetical protein
VIVTIDADSRMSPAMLREIDRLIRTGRYVGGGAVVRPERWSLGIALTGVVLGLVLVRHGVSAAVLWCRREDFEAIGGFDERLVSVEDLDLAKRLKARGKSTGRRFATITRAHVVTSTRKFDDLGDWYLLRHPRLVRDIFTGVDRAAADAFYYDAPRYRSVRLGGDAEAAEPAELLGRGERDLQEAEGLELTGPLERTGVDRLEAGRGDDGLE